MHASEAKELRQIALAEPAGCTVRRTITGARVVAQDATCNLALLLLQLYDAVLDGVSDRESQHAHVFLLADAVHAVARLVLGEWIPPRLTPTKGAAGGMAPRRGKVGVAWCRGDVSRAKGQ